MSSNRCLKAAIGYARRGWRVFPLRGKYPLPGTHGHLDATTDLTTIRSWWEEYPEANIGIACDSVTGPLVIDLDGRSGIEFFESLGLSPSAEATSQRTNRKHIYYEPNGAGIRRAIRPLGDGIALDVLGDGGYVIAPPSVHPKTGRRYVWTNDLDPIEFPSALRQVLDRNADDKRKQAPPLPKILNEGQRDDLLTSLAGSMRRRGASYDAILAALREENELRCVPPLNDKQVRKIAKSISKKPPASVLENLTDLGNARRFIEAYGNDVRCVLVWRRPWLIWTGSYWEPDSTGEVERWAKQTVRQIYHEANQLGDTDTREALMKHATRSEGAERIKAILKLAGSEPEISVLPDLFDANHWLFNTENGTLDLKAGTFRPPKREDLVTKIAPVRYRPKAKCPTWIRFLQVITDSDKELIRYLQRAIGYSMTGDVSEECLFFCYGTGANGKTTFFETIRELFGPYAQQSEFSTFLSRKSDSPRSDIARMRGVRFVSAVEAGLSREFDETVLKQLTGGDRITARKLYEDFFEFRPTHKLWLAANHKPRVNDQSEGFWRRIRLVPFTVYIPPDQRDKHLKRRLMEEMSGILNWALEGFEMWQAGGLGDPIVIQEATKNYRDEEDLVGEFIAQACIKELDGFSTTVELYQAFNVWWRETRGIANKPPSMTWFTRSMGERPELTARKRKGHRGWMGITIKQNFQ